MQVKRTCKKGRISLVPKPTENFCRHAYGIPSNATRLNVKVLGGVSRCIILIGSDCGKHFRYRNSTSADRKNSLVKKYLHAVVYMYLLFPFSELEEKVIKENVVYPCPKTGLIFIDHVMFFT